MNVVDVQGFEGLIEALNNEIEDLPQGKVRENLIQISSALYGIFEDVALTDFDGATEENEILKNLLKPHLSYEDKQYIRFKYDIDLGV